MYKIIVHHIWRENILRLYQGFLYLVHRSESWFEQEGCCLIIISKVINRFRIGFRSPIKPETPFTISSVRTSIGRNDKSWWCSPVLLCFLLYRIRLEEPAVIVIPTMRPRRNLYVNIFWGECSIRVIPFDVQYFLWFWIWCFNLYFTKSKNVVIWYDGLCVGNIFPKLGFGIL